MMLLLFLKFKNCVTRGLFQEVNTEKENITFTSSSYEISTNQLKNMGGGGWSGVIPPTPTLSIAGFWIGVKTT
jgi:hypothetical protein